MITINLAKPCASSKARFGDLHAINQESRVLAMGELLMKNQKTKKCAHIPCLCNVPNGEEYCGEACRDAGSDDVEIACQCDHPACPLTVREYVPGSAADLDA